MSNISDNETDTETVFSDTSSEEQEQGQGQGVVPGAEDQEEEEEEDQEEALNWKMIDFKISRTSVVKTFRVNVNWRLKHFIDRMKLACMLSIGTANVELVQTMQNIEGVSSEDAEAFITDDDTTTVEQRFSEELNVNQLMFYIRILPIQTETDVRTSGTDILSLFRDYIRLPHCQFCFIEDEIISEVVRAGESCRHNVCEECFADDFCRVCG